MAERESIRLWSTTAASNDAADPSINWLEGQLPSTVNNSSREVMAAVARHHKDTNGSLITTGSANAYALTANATWTAYATGQIISFKASFSNTAAATLNVTNADTAALGAKAIRGPGDVALVGGELVSGGRYLLQYDTTANSAAGGWLLLNSSLAGSGEPVIVSSGSASIAAGTRSLAVQRTAPATTALALPAVAAQAGIPIRIFDWSASVTDHVITLTPDGSETIMKAATWALNSNSAQLSSVSLYPSTSLSGWYIAP